MEVQRRREIEQRWKEIDNELAAITEGKMMPGVDPASREDALLDEQDALEFELGVSHFGPR
jgi:hypothetical protein